MARALRHSLWLVASLKFLVPFSALYYLGAVAGLPTPVGTQPTLFTQAMEVTRSPVVSPTVSLISTQSPDFAWRTGAGSDLGGSRRRAGVALAARVAVRPIP